VRCAQNFNKSRIHSHRGVRDMLCTLDGRTIFQGRLQQAPGKS